MRTITITMMLVALSSGAATQTFEERIDALEQGFNDMRFQQQKREIEVDQQKRAEDWTTRRQREADDSLNRLDDILRERARRR